MVPWHFIGRHFEEAMGWIRHALQDISHIPDPATFAILYIEYVEPSVGEPIELVLGSDNASYAVITLRFSAGTRFMTRIAVFDSWNCRFFFRLTARSIDCNEASTASKA